MSQNFPVEYVKCLDRMLARAMAWRTANSEKAVMIQFNFPPDVALITPIDVALRTRLITANPAGRELIVAVLKGETPQTMPTAIMLRAVLEYQPKEASEHYIGDLKCPHCNGVIECASPVGSAKTRPVEGDITVCISCAEVLIFTGPNGIRKPDPGELEKLNTRTLMELDRVQTAVRDKIKNNEPLQQ